MNIENMPSEPKIEKITEADIRPEVPNLDETTLVLQCNIRDIRDPKSPLEMGSLLPEAAESARLKARGFFDKIIGSLKLKERNTIDFLIVASDTELITPMEEIKSDHKRALETADVVMEALKESMAAFSIERSQLLNRTERPVKLSSGRLQDLKMLKDSPEFVNFLKEKYGIGKEFWIAYEDDVERETREKMEAEGPDEISKRVDNYIRTVAKAIKLYHEKHPGRRVVVWAVSHYDAISPYIKSVIGRMKKTDYLPVDKGAGITIKVGKDLKATSTIQGNEYDFNF